MAAVAKIVDEQLGKGRGPAIILRIASERVTARELILRRVADEVAVANSRQEYPARSFLIRFDPTSVADTLSPAKRTKPVHLDEAEEVEAALAAFTATRFVMLADDRQITDLDESIVLTPDSEVVFLRLTPLVGG
jgi:hypothetical protein